MKRLEAQKALYTCSRSYSLEEEKKNVEMKYRV